MTKKADGFIAVSAENSANLHCLRVMIYMGVFAHIENVETDRAASSLF